MMVGLTEVEGGESVDPFHLILIRQIDQVACVASEPTVERDQDDGVGQGGGGGGDEGGDEPRTGDYVVGLLPLLPTPHLIGQLVHEAFGFEIVSLLRRPDEVARKDGENTRRHLIVSFRRHDADVPERMGGVQAEGRGVVLLQQREGPDATVL